MKSETPEPPAAPNSNTETGSSNTKYTVVARRYRPKSFGELVGQSTVAQALSIAIQSGRVGHAYLFTGARGVGKTSTARIFAKALNDPGGPSTNPNLESDVAQAIDRGEDIDVIEIDGASNRGIDEIRQLRANVNVRPSRSKYKIYIIDEVHMLTGAAFNALLKTLEEPPAHVKFIFCTTDPEKIPITVLSRCQRFDFAPVRPDEILERLQFICKSEGVTASDEALHAVARRAAGSMRDSQSLLEQILSFADGKISLEHVHQVLGTADSSLLQQFVRNITERDTGAILNLIDRAAMEGVDAGRLCEQLTAFLRDLMAIQVKASSDVLQLVAPADVAELSTMTEQIGLSTLLAAIQLLDDASVKMRRSPQARILLEVAMVQVCQLSSLESIDSLLNSLDRPNSSRKTTAAKKKNAKSTENSYQPAFEESIQENRGRVDASQENASGSILEEENSGETTNVPENDRPRENSTPNAHDNAVVRVEELGGHRESHRKTPNAKNDVAARDDSVAEDASRLAAEPFKTVPTDTMATATETLDTAPSVPVSPGLPTKSQQPDVPETSQEDLVIAVADADTAVQIASTEIMPPDVTQTIADAVTTETSSEGTESNRRIDRSHTMASGHVDMLGFWHAALEDVDDLVADYGKRAGRVEALSPSNWRVSFAVGEEFVLQECQAPAASRLLASAVASKMGSSIQLSFAISNDLERKSTLAASTESSSISMAERKRNAEQSTLIQQLQTILGCTVERISPGS